MNGTYTLMFTVAPVARERVKPCPAGTVKPLMFTVEQLAAPDTSSRELIVAVQAALARLTKASTRRDKYANMLGAQTKTIVECGVAH